MFIYSWSAALAFSEFIALRLGFKLGQTWVFLPFWGLNDAFCAQSKPQQGCAEPSQVTVNIILLSQRFSFLLPGVYYSSWNVQK